MQEPLEIMKMGNLKRGEIALLMPSVSLIAGAAGFETSLYLQQNAVTSEISTAGTSPNTFGQWNLQFFL